ncbi:MAG: GDSL-type esterase/lipase family protein [Vicinamibacterales bacterium]
MSIARRLTTMGSGVVVTSAILFAGAHVQSFSPAQESDARPAPRGRPAADDATWVTGWGTSQQALGDSQITNATVRMIARITIPGEGVRIRLDNTFGTEPVKIGRAFVGLRIQGAAVAAGSNRPVTFNGLSEVMIPVGGSTWSDPVRLSVLAQQDLAVSLYIPGSNVRPSQHTGAVVTSYRSADGSGDVTVEEGRAPFTSTTTSLWWLKAIDVESISSPGAIVAFGDSITDGTCSTLDAHDRWEDVLSVRLGLEHDTIALGGRGVGGGLKAVVNEGIGGNTITREGLTPPPDSTPGGERLDRDVLSHHGVTDVILFMGTNDIRRGANAAQVIAAMASIVQKVRAKGIRIIGVTIIPRHNVAPNGTNSGWNPDKTRIKNQVNQWIRTKTSFDSIVDFDLVVRDPANPDQIRPAFNCGDGIHPSPVGYYTMGKSVALSLFHNPGRRR